MDILTGFFIVAFNCASGGSWCDPKPYEAPVIIYPSAYECTWKLNSIPEFERLKYNLKCMEFRGSQL